MIDCHLTSPRVTCVHAVFFHTLCDFFAGGMGFLKPLADEMQKQDCRFRPEHPMHRYGWLVSQMFRVAVPGVRHSRGYECEGCQPAYQMILNGTWRLVFCGTFSHLTQLHIPVYFTRTLYPIVLCGFDRTFGPDAAITGIRGSHTSAKSSSPTRPTFVACRSLWRAWRLLSWPRCVSWPTVR